MNEKTRTAISWVVVGIWSVSMIVDMIPNIKYDPPVAIYPALMLVLGNLFGIRLMKGGE
jgi:uncharacterized membrane protein